MEISKTMKRSAILMNLSMRFGVDIDQIETTDTKKGWFISIPDIERYHLKEANYLLGPNFWGPPITPTDTNVQT